MALTRAIKTSLGNPDLGLRQVAVREIPGFGRDSRPVDHPPAELVVRNEDCSAVRRIVARQGRDQDGGASIVRTMYTYSRLLSNDGVDPGNEFDNAFGRLVAVRLL
jgi:hypothetical protein